MLRSEFRTTIYILRHQGRMCGDCDPTRTTVNEHILIANDNCELLFYAAVADCR